MSVAYKVIAPVTTEPITIDDVKSQARVDFDDDDDFILRAIIGARTYAETITHRALATQGLQIIYTLERPQGGDLSGPIERGPNWYEYQEQLGSNPFGAAMFYFDIPQPPTQTVTLIEIRTTVWDPWSTFTGLTTLDAVPEPARLYFQVPATANQWRFTVTAGYDGVSHLLPPDLKGALLELTAFWFDHREGADIPEGLMCKLLAHRVNWV